MLFKALTLFLAIGAVRGAVVPDSIEITAETTLIEFLRNSPALRSSELFNMECFDYYSPLLKAHVDKYDEDSRNCLEEYANAASLIDSSYNIARSALADSVKNTCYSLLTCDGLTSNEDAFQCLATSGPAGSAALGAASDEAFDHKTSLTEKLLAVQKTQSACLLEAQRTYKTNHGQCYDDLIACAGDPYWEFPTTNNFL
ncbi:uncharacterized protein LOC108051439 [Drosophila rhopaloa]|uniref:Uncharacterized protein LOC108051439 n=1 Tax=Drosophila rhopaloa TaxID=1041015 RepID=A0A6P4FV27_DRORH|nr:uncharacterized protein LOC108051439 [Drosophila rhopaloa]